MAEPGIYADEHLQFQQTVRRFFEREIEPKASAEKR